MNSLNIVSRLTGTPPDTPRRSRTGSSANADSINTNTSDVDVAVVVSEKLDSEVDRAGDGDAQEISGYVNEKTPLLSTGNGRDDEIARQGTRSVWHLPHRIGAAVLYGVQVVFGTILAPGRFVIASFYDDQGHFSALLPLINLKNIMLRRKRRTDASSMRQKSERHESGRPRSSAKASRRSPSVDSNASTASYQTSEGEGEDSPARHTRSKTAHAPQGDEAPKRKSIRIKEDSLRKRKTGKTKASTSTASPDDVAAVASTLKSPSSPVGTSKLTKYPRHPAIPRPLVPRRQPSYTLSYSASTPKKTLIIDLDETLIHSMAKGGRMSTGHMVEVRLGGPVSSSGVQIGPGVPILYYVHERPACHEFLRKVSKWFNLIVFTASVQEYADPVIDWLERERKYFSGRYYRQHCTYRNGAYIKDLAQVEPDLSRVMILDNSPMSYIFHEDNAIPIEGWISDPTDHELLHIVPFLEGLQYVTDVRALLALRHGQAQQA